MSFFSSFEHISPSLLTSSYDIPTSGVQLSSTISTHIDSVPIRLNISPVISITVMSSNNQKWFERFIHLAPPKLTGAIGEDSYEFLIDFHEKLYNLVSFEYHRVTYTTYRFTNVAKDY